MKVKIFSADDRAREASRLSWGRAAALLLAACSAATPARARQTQTPRAAAAQQPAAAQTAAPKPPALPQKKATPGGTTVEFNLEPADAAKGLVEGADAVVTFKVTDAASRALAGAKPSAWLSRKGAAAAATDAGACRAKVQSFLSGSLSARPEVDLNSYLVLALNDEANISVIDPLAGFGGSKLLSLVMLRSPGDDWAMSGDGKRVYVSMSAANQIAVVDTATWRVTTNVETGARPTRLRLQPDGKFLWVAVDAADASGRGGVNVVDTATLKVTAVATGAGAHEIAFDAESRLAFVTNSRDGTLSIIDAARLAKIKDLKTGASPAAVAYSPQTRSAYVADEADGSVSVVDAARQQIAARVAAKAGGRALSFAPGGRYGFVVNPKESVVEIFDAQTNRVLHSIEVGKSPAEIGFTKEFAYVRSAGSADVRLIRLSSVGKQLDSAGFPGGQLAPEEAGGAGEFAPAPEGNAMLVANAADKMIYYYVEGMAAPMGVFQNYKRAPRGLLLLDRSLRETAPGVYRVTVTLPAEGSYDAALVLDSPRFVDCFEFAVGENPSIKKAASLTVRVEPLTKDENVKAGDPFTFRFKVIDAQTNQPKSDLQDVQVLAFLSPGVWQKREGAKSLGEGVYEISFTPPQPGVYMIYFSIKSLGVSFQQLPHVTLNAR